MLCAGVGTAAYWVGRNVIGEWGAQGTPIRDLSTRLLGDETEEGRTAWEARAERARSSQPIVEVVPLDRVEEDDESTEESPEADARDGAEEASGTEAERGQDERPGEAEATEAEPAETMVEPERPTTGSFLVRAGSFTADETLEARKSALIRRGYHPWITEYEHEGTVYRRVNVGEFPTREEAELLKKELAQSGIDADVVPQGAGG